MQKQNKPLKENHKNETTITLELIIIKKKKVRQFLSHQV